ncbi:hypothetical protein [Bacillus wiedmannii]|uniref:hypothetical protein n=1 Tax=Bacillus wiedmannii TaxID=1890302 RepID=UPI000BEF97CE|nr:hypothetical protein [Bacillus wiedmannii]PEK57846.1 hypothetical protein CN595_24690 [Bacillus wiedmannii]
MAITIEEIYQEILDNKRGKFPRNTWNQDEGGELKKRVTQYLIEVVLKWNDEDIRERWNQRIIIKSKLTSVLQAYHSSPYVMLNAAYPNRFEAWELKHTLKGFWTYDKSLEILKKIIEEKERLTEHQLLEVYSLEWLAKKNLGGVCWTYFKDSPYAMLNAAYPNRYKEWELKHVPKNFWTRKKALKALCWWIDKKEKLTGKSLLNVYSGEWLKERKLSTPLLKYWNNSPFKMLNEAYPNRFREWELKKVSNNFWESEEKSLQIFKQIIKESNYTTDDIKKHFSLKWITDHGLRTPLMKFWSDSPYRILNAAYPGQFKEWELNNAPNRFWEKEKAKELIKDEIEKDCISISQLLEFGGRKWMTKKQLITPFNKYWGGSTHAMLNELFPDLYKDGDIQVK